MLCRRIGLRNGGVRDGESEEETMRML